MLATYSWLILSFLVSKGLSYFDPRTGSDFYLVPTLPKVKDGGTLNFVCSVKTFPRPAIWFILRETVITGDGVDYKLFETPLGSVLRITPVTYEGYNSQDVMCTARLPGEKTRYRRTKIAVYQTKKEPPGYPTITLHPASTKLVIAKPYHVLDCQATGQPKPKIYWMRNHVPVDDSDPWINVLNNGSLKLHGIDESMKGIYECAAENSLGITFSNQAILKVSTVDVNITLPGAPVNLTATEVLPNRIMLSWEPPEDTYSGDLVSYELFVFENFTKTRRRATIWTGANTEYTLSDLTEGTVHKIQLAARTSHGMGMRTETLVVKTKEYTPGKAMHVHVHIINSTAIRVVWGTPRFEDINSGIIRAYVVETRGLGKDGKPSGFISRTRIPQGNKLTVNTLEPATSYEVRIWGVTRRRSGVPSAPIKVKTFRSANLPPRNLTLMPIDDSTVQLSWAPPARLKDRIITHEIMYYPRVHPTRDQVVTTTSLRRSAVISDLDLDIDYVFQVRGVTIRGQTDWSRKLVFRTYGRKPYPPDHVMIHRSTYWSLKVSWERPDYPVSGYRIFYHRLRNFNLTASNSVAGHEGHRWDSVEVGAVTNVTIHNLEEHLPYAIKVQSRSVDGIFGPASEPVIAGDKLIVLNDMVTDLITLNVAARKVKFKLVPPLSDGYKYYTLSYHGFLRFKNKYGHMEEIDDGPFHYTLPANTTEFTIEDLRPNALYDVNVTTNYLTHNSSVVAIHVKTKEAAPFMIGRPTIPPENEDGKIQFEFPIVSDRYGNISNMFMIVVPSYLSDILEPKDIDTTHPDKLVDIPDNLQGHLMEPYVAASLTERPDKFVLGDGKMYGGFHNKKLQGAREYQVFVRAFSHNKDLWTDSPYSDEFDVNMFDIKGHESGENKSTGVYIFLLICVNLSIFICCGIRSSQGTSSDSESKQAFFSMGEPPFDVACLSKKRHYESTESLTKKDELDTISIA